MKYLGYTGTFYVLRNKKDHIEYLHRCAAMWRSGYYINKQDGEQQAQLVEARIAKLQKS
jgi:hypothetical protein